MRDFNEADRKKKNMRIRTQEDPGDLSKKALSQLEDTVKASLIDGYLPCPVAWRIAKEANVPKVVIGEIADRLGLRITNCQLGCFKSERTFYDDSVRRSTDGNIITMLEALKGDNQLTCARVFDLARLSGLKPIVIANEANARNLKIHSCQLGCF
ncbi:MAG: hypothetical protein KJ624_05460 [Chloroflexi bacterium]|nr:hypothetical protein [Chloroflexota bacterium]